MINASSMLNRFYQVVAEIITIHQLVRITIQPRGLNLHLLEFAKIRQFTTFPHDRCYISKAIKQTLIAGNEIKRKRLKLSNPIIELSLIRLSLFYIQQFCLSEKKRNSIKCTALQSYLLNWMWHDDINTKH